MLKKPYILLIGLSALSFAADLKIPNQHIKYLFPAPDARHVRADAPVLVRPLGARVDIILTGSKSGPLKVRKTKLNARQTVKFTPNRNFQYGEQIEARLVLDKKITLDYSFHIERAQGETKKRRTGPDNASDGDTDRIRQKSDRPKIMSNGVSVPGDFPEVDIRVNRNPADGFIFIYLPDYLIMFDNAGVPWFYRRLDNAWINANLCLNASGYLSYYKSPYFHVMDSSYTVINRIRAQGYQTDHHEFLHLKNGHALLIAKDTQTVDMSKIVSGGKRNARVIGNYIQEFDGDNQLVFEWRCWDHFDVRDAIHDDLTADRIDYVHLNSIEVDTDNHLIISSRHLDEITKIDRVTGEIIWRLGGANNQFTIINDPFNGPTFQHDARRLPNGNLSCFDNGQYNQPRVSRYVEYALDTEKMTATFVKQIRDNPDKYSNSRGNAQTLYNGNVFINWGAANTPFVTEFTADGEKTFEMGLNINKGMYRCRRFVWQQPAEKPYLMVEHYDDAVSLVFNKFMDRDVAYYRIYGGQSPHPETVLDTSRSTLKHFKDLQQNKMYYFRVTAVNKAGEESGYSNEEHIRVQYLRPAQNQILNPYFSMGTDHWNLEVTNGAQATGAVNADSVYHLKIEKPGGDRDIQLFQGPLRLVKDREYQFRFDAWSSVPMNIDAKLEKEWPPHTNYGKIGSSYITPKRQRYTFIFTKKHETDLKARVVFIPGETPGHLYIDNVLLSRVSGSAVESAPPAPVLQLYQNYPNPFNAATRIGFDTAVASRVTIELFDVLGRQVMVAAKGVYPRGHHEVVLVPEGLGSGVYIYRMRASDSGGGMYTDYGKLIYMK